MIHYEKVTEKNVSALSLGNEDFDIFGKLIVSRKEKDWFYEEEIFTRKETMKFPEEDYQLAAIENNGFAIAAFDGDTAVGLAVFQNHGSKYLYLQDLKVNASYRRTGIASTLLKQGAAAAPAKYLGMFTIAQDNNLGACRFYLAEGFVIGGLNTLTYQHTSQEGKSDIFFYHDFKPVN